MSGESVHYWSGDIASAEGALVAGCRFFAGYPITPSSEVAERISQRIPEEGGVFIQMEDELASMAAIIGGSWGGVKSMTTTSGPGYSLMMENLGLAIMMEVPCVVVNIQRAGPSTGLPTLVGQGDVMQTKYGSHGPYEIIALAPCSPQEAFEQTIRAFNLSERYRTPVVLLADECVGHMFERVTVPPKDEIEIVERRVPRQKGRNLPFLPDDDLVPPMPVAGDGSRVHATGLTHDERGYPVMTAAAHEKLIRRLCEKITRYRDEIIDYELIDMEDAEFAVVSYGISARCALGAVRRARRKGIKVGMVRLKTIWPFPEDLFRKLNREVESFLVVEINNGQVRNEIQRFADEEKVHLLGRMGGAPMKPHEIYDRIMEVCTSCRS